MVRFPKPEGLILAEEDDCSTSSSDINDDDDTDDKYDEQELLVELYDTHTQAYEIVKETWGSTIFS
jgi:hypothetical protein